MDVNTIGTATAKQTQTAEKLSALSACVTFSAFHRFVPEMWALVSAASLLARRSFRSHPIYEVIIVEL